jgi:hypothetical protein
MTPTITEIIAEGERLAAAVEDGTDDDVHTFNTFAYLNFEKLAAEVRRLQAEIEELRDPEAALDEAKSKLGW